MRRCNLSSYKSPKHLGPFLAALTHLSAQIIGYATRLRDFSDHAGAVGSDWQHSPLRSGATLEVATQHDNRSGREFDFLFTGDLFAYDGSIGISLTSMVTLVYVVACLRHVRVEVTVRRCPVILHASEDRFFDSTRKVAMRAGEFKADAMVAVLIFIDEHDGPLTIGAMVGIGRDERVTGVIGDVRAGWEDLVWAFGL